MQLNLFAFYLHRVTGKLSIPSTVLKIYSCQHSNSVTFKTTGPISSIMVSLENVKRLEE